MHATSKRVGLPANEVYHASHRGQGLTCGCVDEQLRALPDASLVMQAAVRREEDSRDGGSLRECHAGRHGHQCVPASQDC